MRKRFFAVFLVLLATSFFCSTAWAIEFKNASSSTTPETLDLSIVMRLVGGKGAILRSGKELKLTFRVNQAGYVIIYNIDSDGFITLIYPPDGKLKKAEKDKVYTIPRRGSKLRLKAGRKTGIEYIHALAVNNKNHIDERELYFLSQDFELPKDKRFRTDMDPYLSFNMIDKTFVKDIENNPPASDHTYFFVNKRVDYPSYLCGQCHGTDKFRDPYDEECAEITIEKNFYERKVGYPYPPLFNITHYDEAEEDHYSSTTYYEDNLSNDWDDELLSSNETDIHLTINYGYGGYDYPFYYSGYYPYNNYSYWYPSYFYTDPFYWGFGFNWGYNNWYGYYYPYTWHRPCYRQYDYCWNNFYDGRRSIYANRRFTKHPLNYQTTSNKIRRKRSLANSRLVERRTTRLATKSRNQSRLSRVLSPRGVTSSRELMRRSSIASRKDVVKRRTVHGASNRNSAVRAGSAHKSRTANRAKEAQRIYNPNTRTGRSSSTESNRSRSVTRRPKSNNSDSVQPAKDDNKSRSKSKQSADSRSRTQSTRKSSSKNRSSDSSTSRQSSSRNRSSSSSRNKSSSRGSSSSGKSNRSSSRGRH